jgi:hypothetical protein
MPECPTDLEQYEKVVERISELVRQLDDGHRWIKEATANRQKAEAEKQFFTALVLQSSIHTEKARAVAALSEIKMLSGKMMECWEGQVELAMKAREIRAPPQMVQEK